MPARAWEGEAIVQLYLAYIISCSITATIDNGKEDSVLILQVESAPITLICEKIHRLPPTTNTYESRSKINA